MGTVIAFAAVTVAGLYYSLGTLQRDAHSSFLPYDTFGYFYPNLLYSLDSLRTGEGVLWNRFQNCGQPFFAVSESALLYPPTAIFLFMNIQTGMVVFLFLHMTMAGIFTYLLCRELELGPTSSLCAAFSFQFGGMTLLIASWWPTLLAHYVWLPAALAVCERLIRKPTAKGSILLAVVLALQLLAGYPQLTFLTYQVVALRVVWECVTHWTSQMPRVLAAVAAGLILMPALAAAQFLPSLEVARESLRAGKLTTEEILPNAHLTWAEFRELVGERRHYGAVFVLVPLMLCGLAPLAAPNRRKALGYVLIAALYFGLAFEGPLFDLYRKLPLGSTFRLPNRFLWLTGFACSVLVAFGVEALFRDGHRFQRRPWLIMLPTLAGAGLLFWLSPRGLRGEEWLLVAGALLLCGLATRGPRSVWFVAVALPGLVLCSLFLVLQRPYYAVEDEMFTRRPAVFEFLREKMTLQNRYYHVGRHPDYSMMPKSASIFHVPSITDYETQAAKRYAAFFVRLNHDRTMRTINDFYYRIDPAPRNLHLLNLAATRFVLLDNSRRKRPWEPPRSFKRRHRIAGLQIYENVDALPRAFFVRGVKVIQDPARLLQVLASAQYDPLEIALIEEAVPVPEPSADTAGVVKIVEDHSEDLTLQVDATGPGFVFVSDQFYPGWVATVNGESVPITRANYTFRLVPVPAGSSTVEFHFEPTSVRLGAAISAASALGVCLLLWWQQRRGEDPRSM